MRPIDADALRNVFDAMHAIAGGSHFDHLVLLGIKKYIDDAPTIDAVPVVRCRDCRRWRRVEKHSGKCPFLIGKHQYTSDDHFCSLGVKMDGGAGGV